MKLITWNVNGLRAWLKKNGDDIIKKEKPDILFVQETKCPSATLINVLPKLKNYTYYYLQDDKHQKKGYAGVGIFTKIDPLRISHGINIKKFDDENRIITMEFNKFFLICVYVPNAGHKLKRLKYRLEWNVYFLNYIKKLDKIKPLIIGGDLNVAHKDIDIARPNKNLAGCTKEEREDFTTLLNYGFVDVYRYFYPKKKDAYTFWDYKFNAKRYNIGWRLDYFLCSERIIKHIKNIKILNTYEKSDHCPVKINLS